MELNETQSKELATILVVNEDNRIDSRLVHQFLEIKTVHTTWIQRRIEKYGFVEGVDYHLSILETHTGAGSATNVFMLSLSMAKELSMLEDNEKGKQARLYFIECERRLNIPKTYSEALRALADEHDKMLIEQQKHQATKNLLNEKTIELDENKEWYSVKRLFLMSGKKLPDIKTMQYHGRELTKLSKQYGYEVKKIFDGNYNLVGSYHIDIINKYNRRLGKIKR